MNAPREDTGLAGAHPILSCADALAHEQRLLRGEERAEWAAMARAGRALAAAVADDANETGGVGAAARLLVLCGKGHNGGDALIALHALLDALRGATALVLVVPDFAELRSLTRRAAEELVRAHGPRITWRSVSGEANGRDAAHVRASLTGATFELCLDGLCGMQFRPPLRAPVDWLIERVNAHPAIRLRAAVDLPSGIGDAGADRPFRADFTYATGIAKTPLFAASNRERIGRVRYLDLGFFAGETAPAGEAFVLTDGVLDHLRGLRPATTDKRTFGHLFVVSGSRTMPGAALMAVEAALVSGAGLVTAFVPESLAAAGASRLPEAMWVPMPETLEGGLALEGRGSVVARAARCTALLAGPGLGRDRESLTLIAELLRAIDVPAVLDGDALQPEIVAAHYPGSESAKVLTPHAGEFARIAETDVLDDDALRRAAARWRATIACKGAPTRVCPGGGPVFVSPFGGPVLSRGGSGDVLAGLIAGQLAQGASPLAAAARGVVWHGRAADRLARMNGPTAARVTQLMPHLAAVLQERA